MRRVCTLLLAGIFASSLQAEDSGFAGRQVCASCHAEQARLQAGSGHFGALSKPGEHPLARQFETAESLVRAPGFEFRVVASEDELAVEAAFGDMARRSVVDWAFGAGDQAVTFVSQVDDQWYLEHYWTFYSTTGRYGPTPGHQMTEADDLGQALGVMYRTLSPQTEILRCFRCHSTGPIALGEGFAIEPSEQGVQCEACHGPGAEHAALATAGKLDSSRPVDREPRQARARRSA
ncbi:MAG: multiheme c-type cytochrome [Bryobacterales bacterium]